MTMIRNIRGDARCKFEWRGPGWSASPTVIKTFIIENVLGPKRFRWGASPGAGMSQWEEKPAITWRIFG